MKKVILLAACLFTISTAVNAQEGARKSKTENHEKMTPEQRAQKNVDNLNSIATLSDDQKAKVKDFAMTKITKSDAIRLKYKGQPENKDAENNELTAVKKEYRKNISSILTPEQLEKVKAKNKETKAAKAASSTESAIDAND
jgi:Spy/CpxP family protein refolding chaperone